MHKLYQNLALAALVAAGTANAPKAFAQSATAAGSGIPAKNKIGSFTSVRPTGQTGTLVIPAGTHAFQLLAKQGTTPYTDGSAGTMPGGNDFTAFVGKDGDKDRGYLSVNQENNPGGVSILDLHLDHATQQWVVDGVRKVDFTPLVKTERNCSGGITPWGTVITSEESYSLGDVNGDGYQDVGWQVEIDPATGKIRDYDGDGQPDKLWTLGRMSHENIAVSQDRVTVYQAEDGGSGGVYKFVASQPGNLSEGALYVLKRDAQDPTTGTWVPVPNATKAERNTTRALAAAVGGTNWSGPEDVEFGPDGKMYFTSKGTGTIWRFKDNGTTVSEIEAWVTRQLYEVAYDGGTQQEDWGTGIDNLTFDGEGNLWALQDGGRNNLWVIRPDHTPQKPNLDLFMTTPRGSESTGLTFSPDFKYGFVSIQHPSAANTSLVKDAAGNEVVFNSASTIVFARKEFLGQDRGQSQVAQAGSEWVSAYPNPFGASTQIKLQVPQAGYVVLEVLNAQGETLATLANGLLNAGEHTFAFTPQAEKTPGTTVYFVRAQMNQQQQVIRLLGTQE